MSIATNENRWTKIGYNGALVASTEADVWSGTGVYTFPTVAAGLEMVSSDNAADIGTSIKAATCDVDGTTTTLLDADVDFLAATAVAVGDCVILDKSGAVPEWGYVTAVATHMLTVAGGFSKGGSCATARAYTVIDKSAYTGAQAVKIEYLDGSYAPKVEICVLNGTGVVTTVNLDLFRINSFRVIATGTGNKPAGNLSLRNLADTPIYSYITAGFTRARNAAYTVPAGKTLYINQWSAGYAYSHNSTHYARIYVRANLEFSTSFNTGNIFYPFAEVVCSNSDIMIPLHIPIKLPAKTDLKVAALGDYAGVVTTALRGWLD